MQNRSGLLKSTVCAAPEIKELAFTVELIQNRFMCKDHISNCPYLLGTGKNTCKFLSRLF